jgi:hypothetical protein
VLRSARGADPAIDDEVAAPESLGGMAGTAASPEERLIAVLQADAGDGADHEPIALHEVDPDEIDHIAPHDDVTAVDTGELTVSGDHDQSEVATSLAEALDDSKHIVRRTDLPPHPPTDVGGFNGLPSSEIGHDTAEDLAALFNVPSPWDHDPTPTPPDRDRDTPTQDERDHPAQPGPQHDEPHSAPPTPTYDTADDLAALFNAPSPWDHDPTPTQDDRDIPAQPGPRHDEPDNDEPVVYRHAIGGFADTAMADPAGEPADSWDTGNRNATYSPAVWPWVG